MRLLLLSGMRHLHPPIFARTMSRPYVGRPARKWYACGAAPTTLCDNGADGLHHFPACSVVRTRRYARMIDRRAGGGIGPGRYLGRSD
jgi:hypothetical protein